MPKQESLNRLYENYRAQFKGREIVTGSGNVDCGVLLVGEAPGRDEVRMGKPFVGMAGKNLDEFLQLLGIARDSLYITNAIKYRLSKVSEKTGRTVNKPASKEDIAVNRAYLLEEVDIIKPRYIVSLGNVPLRALTGEPDASIGKLHGRVTPVEIRQKQYLLFPLYHPASIIYNRSLKAVYAGDIKELKHLMDIEQ